MLKSVSEVYHLAKNPPTYTTVTTYQYNDKGSLIHSESYVDGRQLTEGINIEEHEYDDKGREVRTVSYNTLDASSKFYSEREYDEDGKLVSEPDATGKHKTSYRYAANDGKLLGEILPNGSEFAYGYDENGRVTAITHSTEDGEENANNTAYTCGCTTEVKSGNNVVRYTYDGKRRVTAVELNGVENYVTYAYSGDYTNAEKVTATMADGTVSTGIKNKHGNVTKSTCGDRTVNNTYNAKQQLTKTVDSLSGETSFVYNDKNNVTTVTAPDHTEAFTYDSTENTLGSKTIAGNGINHTYEYSYKQTADKALDSIGVNGNTVRPNTDVLGRNIGKSIAIGENKVAEEKISYVKFGDHATNMPSTVRFASNGVFNESMQYRYDAMGNIIEVLENGRSAYRYEYDTLGRLTREDNKAFAKTTTWAYDNNGNIIARYEYAITAKPTSELHLLNGTCKLYTYADNSDQLMSYNGEAFEYDVIGNPTTYRGKSATWAYGRQLATYDGNTFAYDARGRRTAKNGITFTYDSNGNLIKQSNGLEFFYDHTGVFAVKYNGSTYFYRKNAQNDIISLLDNNGSVLVKYKYDAWGKCIIDASTTNTELANLNPFRYRSYYYDVETSLYFLKTRYYDPETGRFITIDDILYLDPESINGLNLYAYCGNNPIMYYDPTGHLAFFIITAIIGAVIGLGLTAYSDYADDGKIFNGSISLWSYLGNTLVCGAIGAFAGAFVSAATTANIFSTATSVLRGAQTLYSFYKTVGATGAVYMMLDNLQNAVHYIPHVFWSGGDVAKNAAAEFAKINGYTTLEMTRVGQYLEGMAYNPKAWELASYNFAHQVPNFSTVHAILYYPQMRENAIWYTQEIIELSKRMINIIFGR